MREDQVSSQAGFRQFLLCVCGSPFVKCDQQPVLGGLWGKRLSPPRLTVQGCGSLTFWLTDGDKPTGAPRSAHQAFCICWAHRALTAASHTPAGDLASTEPGPDQYREGEAQDFTTINPSICALDKQGKTTLIWMVHCEKRDNGRGPGGEVRKWQAVLLTKSSLLDLTASLIRARDFTFSKDIGLNVLPWKIVLGWLKSVDNPLCYNSQAFIHLLHAVLCLHFPFAFPHPDCRVGTVSIPILQWRNQGTESRSDL